jgi:hypothetical protein
MCSHPVSTPTINPMNPSCFSRRSDAQSAGHMVRDGSWGPRRHRAVQAVRSQDAQSDLLSAAVSTTVSASLDDSHKEGVHLMDDDMDIHHMLEPSETENLSEQDDLLDEALAEPQTDGKNALPRRTREANHA